MRKISITIFCLLLIVTFLNISSLAENKNLPTVTSNTISSVVKNPIPNPAQDKRQQAINKATERVTGAVSLLKQINSGIHPIPKYMYNNARIMIIVSSYKRFGEKSGDEAGRGIAIARDPKTRQWSAPVFVNVKDGYIKDQTEPADINDLLSRQETALVFFGIHENARNMFCKEETDLGNLAGVLVSSGIFQYRKHVGDSAALSVGLFGYVYGSVRGNDLIIGASIENSTIKQDKVLNEAVYETKVLEQFLQPAQFIPKPILACTDMMNQIYPGNR
jgi:lipid-binding SYLF domain-containing protein